MPATEIIPQEGRPLDGEDILQNAKELAARIRDKDLASQYDELRMLPPDIVEEIRAAGIMRMNMPKIWGGPEMTAMEQVEVIESAGAGGRVDRLGAPSSGPTRGYTPAISKTRSAARCTRAPIWRPLVGSTR